MTTERCRFAPTTSGPAHPGTLLAALLCWLDARHRGASVALRLEDVDLARCTPENAEDMREALAWLGLDWDTETRQRQQADRHEAALDRLAEQGVLYPCTCSRSRARAGGTRAADGGWRYPGHCRDVALPDGGWRACDAALRVRLERGVVEVSDEGTTPLAQDPFEAMGDPVVRRRDGSVAYHLACVVDDADAGVTRVVRGRDLATSTAIHVSLQRRLGAATPRYRHHFLLLERNGDKLAKLHGAVGWKALRDHYTPEQLVGRLAALAGLRGEPDPISARALLDDFDWSRVRDDDVTLAWDGHRLAQP